jgi:hypothetical protein
VGTPVPFQRCLAFIIATANKEFTLTAGKFVPVSNKTMINVSIFNRSYDLTHFTKEGKHIIVESSMLSYTIALKQIFSVFIHAPQIKDFAV